ncbi:hypothetical protein HMPREF7215_1049 [Pyramidobacter piscolens W5455]|uniref:Uncharacterized protein n=1 Tax=Pyramidobacter piscolens W5455 TaxID=352165 RepID=A0ABP2HTS6_9BACT|nr:hypothetical protein HMPREF7215_1049 [Pyramidobacter piscolens W5455]
MSSLSNKSRHGEAEKKIQKKYDMERPRTIHMQKACRSFDRQAFCITFVGIFPVPS